MTTQHPADWRACPVPSCDHPAHWYTCPACKQDNDPSGPGCDCYGDPEPHYPSTAELAAFRYRINPDAYDCEAFSHPTVRDWERGGIPGWHVDPARPSDARREASALRSRAFARVDDALKTDAWRREWSGIQELYAPRSRRPRTR